MTLDEQMKEAGMISIDDMLKPQPMDVFTVHAGVRDLDTFEQWLTVRYTEMLRMKARMELDKNQDDEMYEWVLSHTAVLGEVMVNFRATKND